MKYAEKFKDPRWQKKRLEICELHEWECENCGAKDKTLHVHHKYYEAGREPWDYLEDDLMCLCETCHNTEHRSQKIIKGLIKELGVDHQSQLIGFLRCALGYKNMKHQLDYEELIGWHKFGKEEDSIKDTEKYIRSLTNGK